MRACCEHAYIQSCSHENTKVTDICSKLYMFMHTGHGNKTATKPCKFTGGMGNDWGKKWHSVVNNWHFSRMQTIVTILEIELCLNVWNPKNHEFSLFSGPGLCSRVFIAWLVHVLKKAFGYIEGQSCPFWQHLAFCFAKATERQNQI